jgi:hypothetical protein
MALLNQNDCWKIVRPNLAFLLASRMKVPLDAHRPLLNRIQELTEFLINNSQTYRTRGRHESLTAICNAVSANLGRTLYSLLSGSKSYRVQSLGGDEDMVAMAIALDEFDMIRSILPPLGLTAHPISYLFGNVLEKAARSSSVDQVRDILKLLLMTATTPFMSGHILSEASVSAAICAAIRSRRGDMFNALFDWHRSQFDTPDKDYFHDWQDAAIQSRQVDLLKTILHIEMRAPRVRVRTFKLACRKGDADIVATLLRKGPVLPNQRFAHEYPLKLAAQTSTAEVVNAILDAGADIDGVKPVIYGGPTLYTDSPIGAAIRWDNHGTLMVLVERGANLSDTCAVNKERVSLDPLSLALDLGHPRCYEIISRALTASYGLDILTYGEAGGRPVYDE